MKMIATAASIAVLALTAAKAAPLPPKTTPLTKAQAVALYSGKTETWGDPAGQNGLRFYAPDGSFAAWSNAPNVQLGKWSADENGRVCFDSIVTAKGNIKFKIDGNRNIQCWDYRSDGGATYSRWDGTGSLFKPGDTGGDWGTFSHAKADPKDPYSQKFAAGDKVTVKVAAALAEFNAPPGDPLQFGVKLTGPAIKEALFGHTQKVDPPPGTQSVETAVAADGSTTIERVSGASKTTAAGVSRVGEGDTYCISVPTNAPERCYAVYKKGLRYAFLFPDGSFNVGFSMK